MNVGTMVYALFMEDCVHFQSLEGIKSCIKQQSLGDHSAYPIACTDEQVTQVSQTIVTSQCICTFHCL